MKTHKYAAYIITMVLLYLSSGEDSKANSYKISFQPRPGVLMTYSILNVEEEIEISSPVFEIDGKDVIANLIHIKEIRVPEKKRNGTTEYALQGEFKENPNLKLTVVYQTSDDNPMIRFRYRLECDRPVKLTKSKGGDHLAYFSTSFSPYTTIKEIKLSEFNEKYHATKLTQQNLDETFFQNGLSLMGPILAGSNNTSSFVIAYEHGSQYPNKFLTYNLSADKKVTLNAYKANYLTNQVVTKDAPFESVWFEIGGIKGDLYSMSETYRTFVLNYLSENTESRSPYIFYNTWGRQERCKWAGGKYLTTMNGEHTLKEIDKAHQMGVEVFVLDAGWFLKTGDWVVNDSLFPDKLRSIRARLKEYNMKLGLWINPTSAARSSKMLAKNRMNRTEWNGNPDNFYPIWETEESTSLCLVSPYWKDLADKLIEVVEQTGASYFKWDGVGQYSCTSPLHFHGDSSHSSRERCDVQAFLQPVYLTKIIERVSRIFPDIVFDFDVTEAGRCVGLQFLSGGKFFIMNNGPYYHNYNLSRGFEDAPHANGNMFVFPGPARGWFTRSILEYDQWIPSILFLTHYQPDDPYNSQLINMASLILGQNGIWGEILKVSDEGVRFISETLNKYKVVREDITRARVVLSGETGGSPEIYEKIDPATGKGAVVIFASASGEYEYITKHQTCGEVWHTEGVTVERNGQKQAHIKTQFQGASAKIIFFGVE